MRKWRPDKLVRHRLPRTIAVVAIAATAALAAATVTVAARPPAAPAVSDTSYLTVGSAGVSRHTAAPIDTQALMQRAVITPQYACADLPDQDFSQVSGAPTTIVSATLKTATSATGTSYQYCDVSGITDPQIQFELQLPTDTYSGRYLQEGCGGYCGNVGVSQPAASGQAGIDECVPLNNGEFALGQDDEGHIGGGNTEAWAIDDPVLKADFGYLSEHLFALAAKAIIASFYGHPPADSYYDGCSDGGREALMEAQRFPADFNGIIAGAPAFNQAALNAMEEPYESTADENPDGSPILTAADTTTLHSFILSQCADPALHDGTIQDPNDCHPDWPALECGATRTASCLTAAKVAAARRLYAGAVAPDGEHLYTGGEPYGAESGWPGIVIPATTGAGAEDTTFFHSIGLGYLRWVGLWSDQLSLRLDTGFPFSLQTFNQYVNTSNPANLASVVDATDPNLSAFYRDGGKLIQWQGWADQFIPPEGSVAYRQAVINTMGAATVSKFYRLYMFPGVYHCGGGYGPNVFDLLTPLVNWVENGAAPTDVVAAAVSGGTGPAGSGPSTGTVEYTRPVYPYPEEVKYAGTGSVDDASSYVGYLPRIAPNDNYQWAGYPFTSGYESWCALRDDDTALACTRQQRR
ncbi:MAG TPA: tannase/feruloyl esterase family alpha/beta hydrolase [Trebonia sp.]|nr:tannase/feruloyl esterase family alpha/beta hydrolase [Trebonia sp.]